MFNMFENSHMGGEKNNCTWIILVILFVCFCGCGRGCGKHMRIGINPCSILLAIALLCCCGGISCEKEC